MTAQRASGALFGMALGDALGRDTEFFNVSEILRRFPPNGSTALTIIARLVIPVSKPAITLKKVYPGTRRQSSGQKGVARICELRPLAFCRQWTLKRVPPLLSFRLP